MNPDRLIHARVLLAWARAIPKRRHRIHPNEHQLRAARIAIEEAFAECGNVIYRGGHRHGILKTGDLVRHADGRMGVYRGQISATGALVIIDGDKRVIPFRKLAKA